MESTGKYWIPVFNVLEKSCSVTPAYPKFTKPQKVNKADHKDAKWICDLFMCNMINPSFILSPEICHLRDLLRYRVKITYMLTSEKTAPSTISPFLTLNWMIFSVMFLDNLLVPLLTLCSIIPVNPLT